MNFVHFIHKKSIVFKEKDSITYEKWLNCDIIRIKFVYLQQEMGFTNKQRGMNIIIKM